MSRVRRFGQFRFLILPMALLFLLSACSRPINGLPQEAASSNTPASDRAQNSGQSNSQSTALLQKSVVGSDLPFGSPDVLPAGTLLAVRLKSTLMAQDNASNGTFEAIVDDSVAVDGNTLIPRGTVASGRIGSVRISDVRPDRGYVRLSLESLNLDGLDLPLKTATLFARQKSGAMQSGTIRLEKGHRLTFQVIEPFYADARHLSTGP